MNANDILSETSSQVLPGLLADAWREGNNAGRGYDPADDGIEDETPFFSADGFDAYKLGDDVVIVADANGPWAVRVEAE